MSKKTNRYQHCTDVESHHLQSILLHCSISINLQKKVRSGCNFHSDILGKRQGRRRAAYILSATAAATVARWSILTNGGSVAKMAAAAHSCTSDKYF